MTTANEIPLNSDEPKRFLSHIDNIWELNQFIALTVEGLHQATHKSSWYELLRSSAETARDADKMKRFEKLSSTEVGLEEFGRKQQDHGFPYAYEVGVVQLWSIFDAAVEDGLHGLLVDHERLRERKCLLDLTGPLIDFTRMNVDDQVHHLLDTLQRKRGTKWRLGVDSYEKLLDEFDLGGSVDHLVGRNLLEFIESRHLLVHRRGFADARFLSRCPWRASAIGTRIRIEHHDFKKYWFSAIWYLAEVEKRWQRLAAAMAKRPEPDYKEILEYQQIVMDTLDRIEHCTEDERC